MKRLLLITLALILTLSIAACGGNNSTPSGSSNISNSANTPSASSESTNNLPTEPPSGTGGVGDTDGADAGDSSGFAESDSQAFAGDAANLFGLEFEDALKTIGKGFYSGNGPAIGRGQVAAILGREIVNDDNSVFVKLKNSINSPQSFVVREISLSKDANILFYGIKIGDALTDAEQRLTSQANKITGGIIGWILEIDGTISDITIDDQLFFNKGEVKEYMTSPVERTIKWTAEIDGTTFDIGLTSSDNKTIDSIVVSSYDNEEIELGMSVPFPEVELNNSFAIPSKPVGLEGLNPQYWD